MKAYANWWISRQYFFDANYFHLLLGLRSFQKSAFLKLTILIFQYFWHQNWDQWQKLSGKNTHIFFSYLLYKNKRVWAEKIGKKRKNSKNPKKLQETILVTNSRKFFKYFTLKIKIINFYCSDFWKLLRPRSKWK